MFKENTLENYPEVQTTVIYQMKVVLNPEED